MVKVVVNMILFMSRNWTVFSINYSHNRYDFLERKKNGCQIVTEG